MTNPTDILIPENIPRDSEVIKDRRINGKTFYMGNGKYKAVTYMESMVHYRDNMLDDNEPFKEIDLTIDDDACCTKAPYQVRIYKDKVGYTYKSRTKGRVDVELVEIGGQPVDNNRFTVRTKGDQLFWDNVADDIDMRIDLRSSNVEIYKQLRTATASRSFKWLVREDTDSACSFTKITEGVDSAKPKPQSMEINTVVGSESIKTSEETGNKYKEYYYEEIWTGRISKIINPSSRQKAWSNDVVYPCIIDALTTENITETADDGYTKTAVGSWNVGGGPFMGVTGAGIFNAGLRFQTLGIPKLAIIDDANIVVTKAAINGTPQLKIYADDVDDAPAWSNSSRPASGFTKTTAEKAWSPTVTGAESIPITSIVQEIINRGSWASGNDIRFGIFDQVGGTVSNYASISGYPTNAAQLVINYTVSTADAALTFPVPRTVPRNIMAFPEITLSATGEALRGIAQLTLPKLTSNIIGLSGTTEGTKINLPAFTVSIRAGLTNSISLPQYTLAASGANGIIATYDQSLPRMIVNVKATQQSRGLSSVNLPAFTLDATLKTGEISSASTRNFPVLRLGATGFIGRNSDADLTFPAFELSVLGYQSLNGTVVQSLKMLTLDAYGESYTNRII